MGRSFRRDAENDTPEAHAPRNVTSWSAPAERERRRCFRAGGNDLDWRESFVRFEGGVALRLPPQSKMARGGDDGEGTAQHHGKGWAQLYFFTMIFIFGKINVPFQFAYS